MVQKENQRVRLTKKLLKESLIELLQTQEIHRVSIRELCEKAGINRSTFYKYYGSQFELMTEIEDDTIQRVQQLLDFTTSSPFMDDELAIAQLTQVMEFLNENAELCHILTNSNVNPKFLEKLFNFSFFPDTRKRMRHENTINAEYIYEGLINACFAIVKRWINKTPREDPAEIARLIAWFAKNTLSIS